MYKDLQRTCIHVAIILFGDIVIAIVVMVCLRLLQTFLGLHRSIFFKIKLKFFI